MQNFVFVFQKAIDIAKAQVENGAQILDIK
jgi:cobalamin-dependent methionine synthase I